MNDFELQHLPEAYRPLSPWTYFGLGILCAGVAVVGFFGCLALTKLFYKFSIRILKQIKSMIIRRNQRDE